MSSTVILDDVIDRDSLKSLQNYIIKELQIHNQNYTAKWYSLKEDHLFKNICTSFLQLANSYFDLSSCIGYEFWTQNNTRPTTRHLDKDEQLLEEKGIYSFPLCS